MPWYPGQVTIGQKVEASVFGMARGFWSQPPSVTSPGTIGSGTAVINSTGFDCMVYASATTGISKTVINTSGTVVGTVPPASTASYYVPVNQGIAITYTGTLTWFWQAV